MIWISTLIGVLAAAAGARFWRERRAARLARRPNGLDDEDVRRIIAEGTIAARDDDAPLDLEEAARAEEEFWSDSWDEPEEYGS